MLRNSFCLNYLFPSSKEVFLHNFRQFLENWVFDGNSTGADLTKIVKILYYLKLCLENSFCLNYLFPSSKEVFLHNFRQFLENWVFGGNSTGADLTKIVKILYYLKLCWKNSFCLNYLFPSSKAVFLHNFRQFLEIWVFDGNWTDVDLTKKVKILYYLKLCLENSFCLNYLFPSSKEVFLHNFRQFLENWVFDGNSTGADLTKIVKILYYLKLCLENSFSSNYMFPSSKAVFLHNFR